MYVPVSLCNDEAFCVVVASLGEASTGKCTAGTMEGKIIT